MSIRIFDNAMFDRMGKHNCSSMIIDDPNFGLISKKDIYHSMFGIDCDGLPNITLKRYISQKIFNSEAIKELDNFKADIYISSVDDKMLQFLNHKPRNIILLNKRNWTITHNDNIIVPQFSDIDEKYIKSTLGRNYWYKNEYVTFTIEIIREQFDEVILSNSVVSSNSYVSSAFTNVVKRLVLEYIMQYRDNPTSSANPTSTNEHKKDKAELLETIDNLQSQINQLKEQIKSM